MMFGKKGELPELLPYLVIFIIFLIIVIAVIYLFYAGGLDFIEPAIKMGGKNIE